MIASLDARTVEICRDTMRHRGPDDAGMWMSDDGRLAMAHRRLSILELSSLGHQPMADPTGELRIVFNGEIYNHLDIRREIADEWRFRSNSDTETLLAAYAKWGEDCLQKLRGMFAFIIFDARENSLFAARDRAGEKPFYYRAHAGGFAAASELKALMAMPAFPRKIDANALNSYLTFGYIPGDSCILSGVNKLPPAHALSYHLDNGACRVWRYWELPAAEPLDDEEALLEELEALLASSVRGQLVADVPVGVLLSGGIDSSLVTALAVQAYGKKVRTFTIAFPGQGSYDESGFARKVADYLGAEHTELAAEPATVELLPELAHQYDEPMCDSSMIPTYLVSRLVRQQCTVALGGDGGDELFGGYTTYQWVLKQISLRKKIPALLRHSAASIASRCLPLGTRGRNYALGLGGSWERALAGNTALFDERHRRRLSPLLRQAGALTDSTAFREGFYQGNRALPGAAMAMDFCSYLPEDILVKVDRAGMLASLEVRAPFLDHRVIEFAFRKVPNRLRVNREERKILPKKLARKLLPPDFDTDRKHGFSLPLSKWFAGPWGRYMEEVLAETPGDLFHRKAIASLIDGQRKGRVNTERIFALTLIELWRREFRISV